VGFGVSRISRVARTRLRRSLHQAVVSALPALPLLFAPAAAHGVIFYSTGDPTHNTTAPTGALANSGWQWELGWKGGFLFTPIAPHYFISAAHIDPGGTLGNIFWYQELLYHNVAFPDGARVKSFGDLQLYRTDETFYSFAPLYDASSSDGTELARDAGLVIGRGTQRGNPINVNGELKGWGWGAGDSVERWGQNKVSGFRSGISPNDQLTFNFDRPGNGTGDGVAEEVHVSAGDSGGGIFLNVNGQWKIAGLISSLQQYRLTAGGPSITAALFDTGGLFNSGGGSIPESATDVPSAWYASRVSAALPTFLPFLDLNPTWNVNADSSWDTPSNWTNNQVPSGVGATADFRTVTTANVTVNLPTPRTVGTINFDDASRYTLTGSAITLEVASGNSSINVASGSHTIESAVTLNNATTFLVLDGSSVLTLSGPLNAAGKAITKEGPGRVEVTNIRAASLTVNRGVLQILPNGTSGGTSKVNSLTMTMANGPRLDLMNNDPVIDYTGSSPIGSFNGSTYTGITGYLRTAYNDGWWNHGGIATSLPNGGENTLAIAEASDILKISGTQTALWGGQTVDATSILIKYTYTGDNNLDGRVNIDDYVRLDFAHSIGNASDYVNGDFNYDGVVDIDDYTDIDYFINSQGTQIVTDGVSPAAVAAVPEPTSVTALGAAAGTCLLGRRRRRARTSRA
jgi:hypothetical protein